MKDKRYSLSELLLGKADIRAQLKFKNIWLLFTFLSGAAIGLWCGLNPERFRAFPDDARGIYMGLTGALTATGIVGIIKNLRLLKNEKLLRRHEILVTDERNLAVQKKAIYLTTVLFLPFAMLTGLLIAPKNPAAAMIIFYGICAFLAVYLLVLYVVNRCY